MIFPAITETIVLPLTTDEVERRIGEGIKNGNFIGVVGRGSFSLSANVVRPPQFQPKTVGRIEGSSRGSMIFVSYELFPGTKVLMAVVSIVMLAICVGVAIERSAPYYPLYAIGLALVLRTVAMSNIRLHRTPVRQNLLDILS